MRSGGRELRVGGTSAVLWRVSARSERTVRWDLVVPVPAGSRAERAKNCAGDRLSDRTGPSGLLWNVSYGSPRSGGPPIGTGVIGTALRCRERPE